MLSALYGSMGVVNPSSSYNIEKLLCALVKTNTCIPIIRTKIMHIEPVNTLFETWSDNKQLSLKELTFMLRPSDLAAKGVTFH